MGGGVPRTTLDRLEWDISGFTSLPGKLQISGSLLAADQERAFAFELVLDD